jgi:hypothetical protein
VLQSFITLMLGGRESDPSDVLLNGTRFNDDLWRAEHLYMGDEELRQGVEDRHPLTQLLKRYATTKLATCSVKYGNSFSARPVWRITVSANEDSDSIRVIPPPTYSLADKIAYLKCWAPDYDVRCLTEEEHVAWQEGIAASLPAFLREVDAFEIPEGKRGRFMIETFHHPEIVELIESSMLTSHFADCLLNWIAETGTQSGTASELFQEFRFANHVVTTICKNPMSFSTHLGILMNDPKWAKVITKSNQRIGSNRMRQTIWTIHSIRHASDVRGG